MRLMIFESEHNRVFTKAEVSFRVPFSVTGIRGQDLKLGDSDNLINLLVLEFESKSRIETHDNRA